MAVIHKKVWKEYFAEILTGRKRFELRLADFEVHEGDTLVLEEWDQETQTYTGRSKEVVVTYALKTKDLNFWPQSDIDTYGYQVIQFG
ncbi:MAG: DUF3850 domain-containing protein [Patescibacteria group bacterium]